MRSQWSFVQQRELIGSELFILIKVSWHPVGPLMFCFLFCFFIFLSEFADKAVVKATANSLFVFFFLQAILFRFLSQLYNEGSNWIRNYKYLKSILSLPICYCNYTFHVFVFKRYLACLNH